MSKQMDVFRTEKDEQGRPVWNVSDNGKSLKYYKGGSNGEGFIFKDSQGREFIVVQGEVRYWKGKICPLPADPRITRLRDFLFIFLKPDALKKGLQEVILAEVEEKGYEILAIKKIVLTLDLIYKMYPYFFTPAWEERLIKYFASGPCLCALVQPEKGGSVNYYKAVKMRDKIRKEHKYIQEPTRNIIHCSDSEGNTIREALLMFSLEEILEVVGLNEEKEKTKLSLSPT